VPSSDPFQRFEDILDNIAPIEDYTAGMNAATFIEDNKTYDARERCLEPISDAAKKPGAFAEDSCPGIPWPEIRGLGTSCGMNTTGSKANGSG
jgi:uncharacterized protein with HEPN domain